MSALRNEKLTQPPHLLDRWTHLSDQQTHLLDRQTHLSACAGAIPALPCEELMHPNNLPLLISWWSNGKPMAAGRFSELGPVYN
jgi:hypothetical protein